MTNVDAQTLSPELRELLGQARAAAGRAYAPYSRHRVGAALRTRRGAIFVGCNVENASLGLTICAERNAVSAAILGEGSRMRIGALVCVVLGGTPFPPCGACRQVIAEFAGNEIAIVYAAGNRRVVHTTLGALLPQRFEL